METIAALPTTAAAVLPGAPVPGRGFTRPQWVIFALILVAAAVLRFADIAGPSLWMDEIWSIEMSAGRGSLHDRLPSGRIETASVNLTNLGHAAPWWDIWTHMNGVTHPPLYHIVLRWWMDLFGNGAGSTRSLSAIFSLIAVAILADAVRLLQGPRVALLAAAIMALAIGQLDFAQEARSYSMIICLGLGAADAVVRIEKYGSNGPRLISLALLVAATALTHYFSAGALLAIFIYALIRLRGATRWNAIAAFAIAAIVVAASWGPFFVRQSHSLASTTPDFLREAVDAHVQYTLRRIIGLPAEYLFGESQAEAFAPMVMLLIAAIAFGFPLAMLWRRRDLLLWALWMFGVIGAVAALDLAHRSTAVGYVRYTELASPGMFVILAAIDWPKRGILRSLVPSVLITLLIYSDVGRLRDGVPAKEDWRQLAGDLQTAAGPGDLLAFFNPSPWASAGMWYMGFKYYEPASRHPWLIMTRPASPPLLKELGSHRVIWLVGLHPQEDGPVLFSGWQPTAVERTSAGAFCRLVRAARP